MRKANVFAVVLAAALAVAAGVSAPAGAVAAEERQPHGLKAEYYVSSAPGAFDFGELKSTVVDPNIGFGNLEPILQARTGQRDHVTVRWTGQIQPEYSEKYTFSMIGDNGFRLWVDGQLIIDHWVNDWNNEQVSEPIALEAGQKYDIKVEFFEDFGGSNLFLRWSSPSQQKEIVPREALYLPEGFDYRGPLAASVSTDGKTIRLDFGETLTPLPDGAAEHFEALLGGSTWPVKGARLDPGDHSVVLLQLGRPVPGPGTNYVRVTYDGYGGITTTSGTELPQFGTLAVNNSEYTLTTPWTDDVSKTNPRAKYPRPQMKRDRWKNLNGQWQFAAATEGEAPPFGQDLPKQILVPFPVESKLSGIQRGDIDRMWYRRTFSVPESWRLGTNGCPNGGDCPRLLVHFGAVDWRTTVYVNGEKVTTHKGGFDSFTADVTEALEYGPNGKPLPEQELVVGVYDPTDRGGQAVGKQRENPGGIFYTGASGIWQTVWMEPVSAAHITGLKMTPDLTQDTLQLTVHTDGVTDEKVVATAYADGRRVGRVTGPANTRLRLPVPDPKLWSPKHPYLYDLNVKLVQPNEGQGNGGRPVDKVDSYFGMRSIGLKTVNGKARMTLNGDFVFQTGLLDQGYWPDGIYTAPTDAAMKYDLKVTKRLGFNMVRKHVKVEPNRWYYYADKMGLLVWQDMPSMPLRDPKPGAQEQFIDEMHEMVKENESHPSIVTWVPFNEGWGEFKPEKVTRLINKWDPSLLVDTVSGINCCLSFGSGDGDIIDWHTYGYLDAPVAEEDRASVVGEYGGLALKVEGHTWAGHGFGHGRVSSEQELTDRYVQYADKLGRLMRCKGTSAAIYTQTTDVELELNGFLTYDRRVIKGDIERIRQANQELIEASRHLDSMICKQG